VSGCDVERSGKDGGESGGGRRCGEKEKAEKDENRGERLIFLSTLHSIFFSLRT